MAGTFLIKLTRFEKTESIFRQHFYSAGNFDNKKLRIANTFRKRQKLTVKSETEERVKMSIENKKLWLWRFRT